MRHRLFVNATLIDGTGSEPSADSWVRVEAERITGVGRGRYERRGADIIDCQGRTLMPGLIDCHTHVAAARFLNRVDQVPRAVLAANTFRVLRELLEAGFTTVRDAGFTDHGFKLAVDQGHAPGPRLFLATGPLSQTGGHSDFRGREEAAPRTPDGLYHPGLVVDGVDACRRGAREVLRRGADHVKVMASGGCTSPTDRVEHDQFTLDELRAVVAEAVRQDTYVMAHAYTPSSIRQCVEAGVRSIEHANFVDEETAGLMAASGTYAVPTIVTYELLAADGLDGGMPAEQVDMVKQVLDSAYDSLAILAAAGVRIGSGSDLLGPHQGRNALELELAARVLGPLGAIRAATETNARLLGLETELGTVETGKLADLILVDGNPAESITTLGDRARIHLVMKAGAAVARRADLRA